MGYWFYWRGCVDNGDTQWEDMKNNWEAENNIEEKFGDDWKEKFNKEVLLEFQRENKKYWKNYGLYEMENIGDKIEI